MLVRNGSEVVNDWYPFIAQFPLDVAQARRCMLLKTPPLTRLSLQTLCSAYLVAEHMQGRQELTAAEAWHEAKKQLNPYKAPHYENELVAKPYTVLVLWHCARQNMICSRVLNVFITFICSVLRMSLRSKVPFPVLVYAKMLPNNLKPNKKSRWCLTPAGFFSC